MEGSNSSGVIEQVGGLLDQCSSLFNRNLKHSVTNPAWRSAEINSKRAVIADIKVLPRNSGAFCFWGGCVGGGGGGECTSKQQSSSEPSINPSCSAGWTLYAFVADVAICILSRANTRRKSGKVCGFIVQLCAEAVANHLGGAPPPWWLTKAS